jgi:hypothetical protein
MPAPLRQLLYGSFSTAATGFRPLTPSQSFCDVKPLQPRKLACASAGVQLLPAAPAALMQPLPPSRGPCRPHTAPASSCSPCRHQRSFHNIKPGSPPASYLFPAAPAAVQRSFRDVKPGSPPASYLFPTTPAALLRPLLPSCGPCRHHAVPAAIMRPLLSSCSPCQRSS